MHRKSSVMDSPLIKLQGCNFIKKRLQRRCFPVNIAKFLKTTFLLNTSGDYFWKLDLKTFFVVTNQFFARRITKKQILWRLTYTCLCECHQLAKNGTLMCKTFYLGIFVLFCWVCFIHMVLWDILLKVIC